MPESTISSTIPDPHVWILILAGGSGTRFWPASTPGHPKPLLPLAGERPLIQDTLDRARELAPDERIRILTGARLLGPFAEALGDLPASCLLAEPHARGTGPVLAWAAWMLSKVDPEAVLVSLHADHAIHPREAFRSLLADAAQAARTTGALLTVAVPPSRPEVGFGYLQPGEDLDQSGGGEAGDWEKVTWVRAFVEKPDRATAERYVGKGYLWNSGIFIWKASSFLDELRAVAPELADLLPLLDRGDVEGFFREAPTISVDEAVLERSSRVAFMRATFQWDDVGAWEALARTRPHDDAGNVAVGSIRTVDASDNIVMIDEGEAVLFGVQDLVVVRWGDVVMVARRSLTPDLKSLLDALPAHLRDPDIPPSDPEEP